MQPNYYNLKRKRIFIEIILNILNTAQRRSTFRVRHALLPLPYCSSKINTTDCCFITDVKFYEMCILCLTWMLRMSKY